MPFDERWLADVLARGQVRVVGSGGAGERRKESADTPGLVRPHVSEKAFMAAVVRLARQEGWLAYHVHDSRRSLPGYPDLTLVHPQRHVALWAELKVPGGVLTLQQMHWLHALGQVERTEASLWTPEDWPGIEETLKG